MITKSEMSDLTENMVLAAQLKKELKERCRVFDVEAKELAAMANSVPRDTYYHLPVVEWQVVKDVFTERQEAAFETCLAAGILGNLPFSQFPLFRNIMNLPPLDISVKR